MDLKANAAAVALLRKGAWFGSLPPDLQATILQRGVVRSYRKGQVVIQEGESPKGLFAVLEGAVRGLCQVGDADEVLIHVGEAGLWFGVYGLLSGAPSIGSVITDAATQVLILPIAEFGRIVEEEPRYYRHFAALALQHYALLYRYVAEGHGLPREELLCRRLVDLAEFRRRDNPTEGPVSLTVSQADLATMIGVARQTVNVILTRLEAHGLIEVGFRTIRILDEERLRKGCRTAPLVTDAAQRASASPRPAVTKA